MAGITNNLACVTAVIASGGAVSLLRFGWERDAPPRRIRMIAGWVLVIVAVMLASSSLGVLVGTSVALLAFSLFGFGAVALNMERRTVRERAMRVAAPAEVQPRAARTWGRGLTASLLVMTSALALGAAVSAIPLGDRVDRVTLGPIILPLVWAGFMIWALSDPQLSRPAIGMTCVIIGSSAVIALALLT